MHDEICLGLEALVVWWYFHHVCCDMFDMVLLYLVVHGVRLRSN
jgi:hypothetical protein